MSRIQIALLLLLAAAPLAAQEWQVAREQFVFTGTRLAIDVDVEAPGTLRVIRGEPGSVHVASRSRDGFTTSGLATNDRLTLSAAGSGPVDYLVAVPENTWLQIRLPGRHLAENVARGRSGSWDWNAAQRPGHAPVTEWQPELDTGPWNAPLYTTFSRARPPQVVSVPDLAVVDGISVRFEGQRFKVIAGRPLSTEDGSASRLVIRPAGPPMKLVLQVPVTTSAFSLELGTAIALVVDDGAVTTLCAPVTEQWLSDGRRWFTFNPRDGSLRCGSDSIQRHGG